MKLQLTTDKILITGIVLLVISIATFIFFPIAKSKRIDAAAKLEAHTQEVLLRSEKIVSLVSDNEANARGYELTGQQSFLGPVEKMQKEIFNQLAQLKVLTGNNPVQQAGIDSLSFYIDKRITFSNHTIAVRKLKGEDAAKVIVEMRKGKIYTDRIHLIIDKMQATENALLAQQKEASHKKFLELNSILIGVVIAIFIIFIVFILKIRAGFIARKKAGSDLAKLNAGLEQRVFERTNEVIKSKNVLSETFERITDAFVALDKNWCFTYMNKKAGEIFQRGPEQMIGKHIWTEFPEGISQPFYKAYYKAMEMQQYIYLEEYYAPYGLWFENHIYPSPDGLSIFFREITEKKKAEEALNNNRIFIESIINASPDIIYIYDFEERKNIYINEGIQINLGYSDDEIKQMGDQVLSILMYPGDFDFYLHNTYPKYETLKDKEIITHEYRMKDKNGNWHWLYSKESIFFRKPDGTPKQIFGITTDITEQKKIEDKLYKSEELLRLSSELANVAAWEYDVETNSMSRSDNHDKLYGIENQGKWERNTFIDATHPDDRGVCNMIIDNSLAIGGPDQYKFDFRIIHPDKSIHWLNVIGKIIERNPEGFGKKIRGFITDITDRKKAEDAIKASEEKYRDLIENITDIICTHDLEGQILFVNSAAEKLLGYKFNPQRNFNLKDILAPDTKDQFDNYIDGIKKEGHRQGLMKVQTYTGEIRIWEYNNSLITTGVDAPIVRGFTRDITEQKKAEHIIKASEEKYRTLIEQASDGIFISDENGKYVEVNESGCRLLGYTKEEIYQLQIKDVTVIDEDFIPFRFDEIKEGKTVIQQRKLRRKDGSVVPVEISARQLPDGRMLGMIRNITERIEAQQMLQKEKELSEKIINSLPGLFYLSDATPKLLRWNKTFETASGYTTEELGKIVPINLFDPADHQIFKQSMADTYKVGYGNSEATLITKSGQKTPFYFTGVRIEYEGRPAMLGTGINISELKKAEHSLIVSEKNYRSLVEHASDGIIQVNEKGEITLVNTAICHMLGYSKEELLKMRIEDTYSETDKQLGRQRVKQVKETGGISFERIMMKKDGKGLPVDVSIGKTGTGQGLAIVRDITERKKAEDAIIASEEKYRTLVEQASDAIFIADADGRFITVNDSACKLSQYSQKELLQMTIYDFALMEDIQSEPFHFEELKQGKTVHTERILKAKDGIPITVEITSKLLSDGRLLTFVRDISERKKTEDQTKQLTQQLLKAEEIARFGFLDWNLITNEIVLSPRVNIIYGIPENVVNVAEFINKVAHPDDKQFINENLELAVKGIKEYNIDHRIIRTDGTIIWVNARAELTRDANGGPVRLLGTILDITESKLAEEKLKAYNDELKELTAHLIKIREEERKRIARGIHDELGQQLTAIKMDVAWINKKIPEESTPVKNKIKNIITLLDGSNESLRRILSELRPAILDEQGLLDAIEWIGRQFTSNTGIPVKFTTKETEIKLSETTAICIFRVYQEAFTNITRYAGAKNVTASLSVIDDNIVVTIEDDGKGFDAASVQKNSFGILGMKERVVALNGKFELVSSPGKGTKIMISLPYKNT